jgi:hypothetical protein
LLIIVLNFYFKGIIYSTKSFLFHQNYRLL